MTTLFGGWEPTIIVVPPEIPTDPTINVAAPVLNSPAHITSSRRVSTGGEKVFTNAISDVGLAYSIKDNQAFSLLQITDHVCDDKAGLIRVYYGATIAKLVVERISLLRGHYSNGVTAGVVNIGGSLVDEIVMRDINYEREQPVMSPGDVYGGIFTGGGKDPDGLGKVTCNSLTIERCRSRNTFVGYTDDYPNSDVVVCETSIKNILIRNCDFRFGSDAGIDMKGTCRVETVICEGFRESFKFWEPGQDGDVYTKNPRVAHWVIPAGGEIVERVVEFAAIVQDDPTTPIVEFQKRPHKLILQRGYLEAAANQVLAKADKDSYGATVQMGDKSIVISKPITMLSELLS